MHFTPTLTLKHIITHALRFTSAYTPAKSSLGKNKSLLTIFLPNTLYVPCTTPRTSKRSRRYKSRGFRRTLKFGESTVEITKGSINFETLETLNWTDLLDYRTSHRHQEVLKADAV
jgi:hypothetical protein